jgi:hypothetical protein
MSDFIDILFPDQIPDLAGRFTGIISHNGGGRKKNDESEFLPGIIHGVQKAGGPPAEHFRRQRG